MPQTFEDVVDMLIPELQARGIFWDDYCVPGGTYRENTYEMKGQAEPLPDHIASSMIWRPPMQNGHTPNGIHDLVNGHLDHGEELDPVSFQLS